MSDGGNHSPAPWDRRRLLFAGLLAACVVVLILLNIASEKISRRSGQGRSTVVKVASPDEAAIAGISSAVDSLFVRYQIDRRSVKSWYVQTPDKQNIRMERRVVVPADFITMNFNLDLNRMVEPYGARVIATERTKESTVMMHIIKNKFIVQSITFLIQPAGKRR